MPCVLPGEVVPGSQDPGSGRLHRLPGGELLAHRLLGGCSSRVSVSCPSLVSVLIVVACSCLWSWFSQCSESPLLAHQETMVSCLSPGKSRDFFPDSVPVNCGALAPFRLCSCSQPQSSPWDLISEAGASAPIPHPPQQVSRQASQAGEYYSTLILCAGIFPFCPLHPCCYVLLRGSEASLLPPAPGLCQ